jgi:hypothetical protein
MTSQVCVWVSDPGKPGVTGAVGVMVGPVPGKPCVIGAVGAMVGPVSMLKEIIPIITAIAHRQRHITVTITAIIIIGLVLNLAAALFIVIGNSPQIGKKCVGHYCILPRKPNLM